MERHPGPDELRKLERFMQRRVFAGIQLTSAANKHLIFTVSAEAAAKVLELFPSMVRHRQLLQTKFGMQEWGLAQSSLEDVFIRTVDPAAAAAGSVKAQGQEQPAGDAAAKP
jgi:hypothetical protein